MGEFAGLNKASAEEEFIQSLEENLPLAPMTTLKIGGPARYFAEATSSEALAAGVGWAQSEGLPFFILGGGSNTVIADEGFKGLVLRVAIRGMEYQPDNDQVIITAGAGEDWDALVEKCVARAWAGFECLSGIPGRVGATPIQNVGAYGQETSESLLSLEAFDMMRGEIVEISAGECEFGYRQSRFKTRDRDRFIITRVTYRLTINGRPMIRYSELERYLADNGATSPTLAEAREAVIAIRRRKAMVIDAEDTDSRSAGSFFVNPTVSRDELDQIRKRAARFFSDGEQMPSFPATDDRVKLSAAWLIERAGIQCGFIHGNVGTSTKHALAIINRGGGTAREIVELKEMIQSRVMDRFGVALTMEPVFVGFDT